MSYQIIDSSVFLRRDGSNTMTGRLNMASSNPIGFNTGSTGISNYSDFICFHSGKDRPSSSVAAAIVLRIRTGDKIIDGGPNGSTQLGDSTFRWKSVYAQAGNFSGNLTVSGTINGTTVASLVTLDDLAEVLSVKQMTALEAKVQQRVAIAKAAMEQQDAIERQDAEVLLEHNNAITMENNDLQNIMGGGTA